MNVKDIGRHIRRPFVRLSGSIGRLDADRSYSERVAAEKDHFHEDNTADELPPIFHYWSNRYLRPKLETFDYSDPEAMFAAEFERAYRASDAPVRRFLSIGSGRADAELRLARKLMDRGCEDFVLECMELNPDLLAQAKTAAERMGLGERIATVAGDANRWTPDKSYDAVLANSSLHHIVNLEGVFEGIAEALVPSGIFVTSDTIGRNGHMRWPEALAIVHDFWRELPPAKTYNHLLRRFEAVYENWDCSSESFEGIRAQDILPLLIQHFDFDVFLPFANVVDPFVDRAFGPNFDAGDAADAAFVDRVHFRDEAEIARGAIKPTHLVAAMCVGRPGRNRVIDHLTPQFCVRSPRRAPRFLAAAVAPVTSTEGGAVSIAIVPERPLAFGLVVARLSLEGPFALLGVDTVRSERDGVVVALAPLPAPAASARTVDVQLGRFPAGRFRVTVEAGIGHPSAAAEWEVGPKAPAGVEMRPLVDYSDQWWDPTDPGWGIGIAQHASDGLLAIWAAHDERGEPTWFSLQPGQWVDARTFRGPIYRSGRGQAREAAGASAPAPVCVGTATLTFDDFDSGHFSSEIDGRPPRTSAIRRMRY
jgi:SAM-dependent methyltransferase